MVFTWKVKSLCSIKYGVVVGGVGGWGGVTSSDIIINIRFLYRFALIDLVV